jgi:hypothetical protein
LFSCVDFFSDFQNSLAFLPERRRERWEGGSWRAKRRDSASGLKKLDLFKMMEAFKIDDFI